MSVAFKCNHCDSEFTWEEVWENDAIGKNDGDQSEINCPECNKKINVLTWTEMHFEAIKEDD